MANQIDPQTVQTFNDYMSRNAGQVQTPQAPNPLNGILNFALPTGGAILGGLLGGAAMPLGGEIVGGAGGAAGGQALADLLTGQKPGGDVVASGAGGLVGGVGGKLLGGVLKGVGGKFAGRASQLLGNPTDNIFTSVVQKDPWMTQNVAKLTGTANKLGYMNQPIAASLDQMPGDFANINEAIKGAITKNNTQIPLSGSSTSPGLLDNFQTQLEKASVGEGDPQFDKAVQSTLGRMQDLGQNGVATAQDIYGEKSKMSNVLANTFNKQAKGTLLSPKEEVNLSYFHALKDTLGQYGSPEVQALNQAQNHMYDIAKAFGGVYAKQAGKTPLPPFSFQNLIPEEAGGAAAALLHLNPILGVGAGLASKALSDSPGALAKGAAALDFLGKHAAKTGAATGSLLGAVLQTNPEQNNEQQNILDHNSSPSGDNITQGATDVKGGIKSFDGSMTFPAQLPDISSVQNQIPGQPYPQDQYMQDVQTIQGDIQRAAGNPVAMESLNTELQAVNAKKAANDDYVKQYTSQNQLDPQQQQFMRSAKVTYDNMNTLRTLIGQYGVGPFQAAISDNPAVQRIKVLTDPSGNYAKMVQLIGQLRGQAARAIQGGRPTNFDLQIYSAMDPANPKAANLQNLDQSQKVLLEQYGQYSPLYNLEYQTSPQPGQGGGETQASLTGHPGLDQIIGAGR